MRYSAIKANLLALGRFPMLWRWDCWYRLSDEEVTDGEVEIERAVLNGIEMLAKPQGSV